MGFNHILLICIASSFATYANDLPPSCESKIFCQGDLLHLVQTRGLANSTTNFVRYTMKYDEQTILDSFDALMKNTSNVPTDGELSAFLGEYFEITTELESWTPEDLTTDPQFLSYVKDQHFLEFGKALIDLWSDLGRQITDDVRENPDRHTLIPVPNPFIIPGGMFEELYYWDSYWIIKGLLLSEMPDTAKGMIENLLHLVRKYGFIPNGSRIFYLNRSQPPLLTSMVKIYIEYTNDLKWLAKNINAIEEEIDFWLNSRTVDVTVGDIDYVLLRYNAATAGPRPESYANDYNNSLNFDTEAERQQFYTNIKSAAESGWDFSTRWFKPNSISLLDIQAVDIIPVDLNAFFAGALKNLGDFWQLLGYKQKATRYWSVAKQWRLAIQNVMWDDESGAWHDFDLKTNTKREAFYPANFAPLWAGAVEDAKFQEHASRIFSYLNNSEALTYIGGIPTSLVNSSQQWDLYNVWPPLEAIVINCLELTDLDEAKELAISLAEKFLTSNYLGFLESGQMFEKYDALTPGQIGGGGEYTAQTGFGWSNGVAIELLNTYGDRIQFNANAKR